MTTLPYRSERLREAHDTLHFHCGTEGLDEWLTASAMGADRSDTARTFVWSNRSLVVAYFALCPHVLRRSTLPGRWNRTGPHEIPAILLAKLALDGALHGRGLGQQLLVDALARASRATDEVGGRVVVVDAIDAPAHSFYAHFGFTSLPEGSTRLVMRTSDVRASLAATPVLGEDE